MNTILTAYERLEKVAKLNSSIILKIIVATLQIIAIMLTLLIK